MITSRLFELAASLNPYSDVDTSSVDQLVAVAKEFGKAFSGSWLGYHSRVYYNDFEVPPPGSEFSQEWGFTSMFSDKARKEWTEYAFDQVVSLIHERAGTPDLEDLQRLSADASIAFENVQNSTLSLIYTNYDFGSDKFMAGIMEKVESARLMNETDIVNHWLPKGQVMSRDTNAIMKGSQVPPHISVLAKARALLFPFDASFKLQKQIRTLASHIENLEKREVRDERIGTNIFIGHGRSGDWRILKDFVSDRLELPWDEFNRVPVAGVTNITRLSQMLDQASFAFLVMTAEDEQADGNLHARMNVIHEVGLFQGRLGFERAIVLLEEGCQEFTNIQGLGQLRYPRGNMSAIFEDIRSVLEREGIVG